MVLFYNIVEIDTNATKFFNLILYFQIKHVSKITTVNRYSLSLHCNNLKNRKLGGPSLDNIS